MNTFKQYLTEATKVPRSLSKIDSTLVKLGYRLVSTSKDKTAVTYLYVDSKKFAVEITADPEYAYAYWGVGKYKPGKKFSADGSGLDNIDEIPDILKDYAG